jgi:hypothetical protein
MKQRLGRLRTDERGMSLLWVAGSIFAFFAASMLAIDVGLFMTARTQAATADEPAGATPWCLLLHGPPATIYVVRRDQHG